MTTSAVPSVPLYCVFGMLMAYKEGYGFVLVLLHHVIPSRSLLDNATGKEVVLYYSFGGK